MAKSLLKTPVRLFLRTHHDDDRNQAFLQPPHVSPTRLHAMCPTNHASEKVGYFSSPAKSGLTPVRPSSSKKKRRPCQSAGIFPIKPHKKSYYAINMAAQIVKNNSPITQPKNLTINKPAVGQSEIKNTTSINSTTQQQTTVLSRKGASRKSIKSSIHAGASALRKQSRIPIPIEHIRRAKILELEKRKQSLLEKITSINDEINSLTRQGLKRRESTRQVGKTGEKREQILPPIHETKNGGKSSRLRLSSFSNSLPGTPVFDQLSPALLSGSKLKTAENYYTAYRRGYTNLSTPLSSKIIEQEVNVNSRQFVDDVSERVFSQLVNILSN